MYRYKTYKLRKGYILVYTLLIVSLLMIITIYGFTLQLKKTKNVKNYEREVSTFKIYEQYRETLLSELKAFINLNISVMSKESIRNYFTANSIVIRTDVNKAAIRYNQDEDKFYLESRYDSYNYRREVFDYEVVDSNIRFLFVKEEYVKGVIV